MFGFILNFILIFGLLALGIYEIIKHPYVLSKHEENVLLFFIIIGYIFNFLEKTCGQGTSGTYFSYIHPFANFSPFLFTLTIIVLFLPTKLRKYYYALVILLSAGMILAGFYNAIGNLINLNSQYGTLYYTCIGFDELSHILIGLFGLYLSRNKIIEFNKKERNSVIFFSYCVCILMIILNIIFDQTFFGLNLNGKHNIYYVVYTSNSYLSAFIYFLGLTVVMILGCYVNKLLRKVGDKK